jgi:hypothetical protein
MQEGQLLMTQAERPFVTLRNSVAAIDLGGFALSRSISCATRYRGVSRFY